jgi:hypothetical protein
MADFAEEGGAELSKNAAKKAAKAAEAAKAKAEKEAAKAAAAAAAPPKTAKLGEEVEELDPTKYFENRLTQIAAYEVRGRSLANSISIAHLLLLTRSNPPPTHPTLNGNQTTQIQTDERGQCLHS